MSIDIHLSNRDDLVIDVTHFENDTDPWCSVHLKSSKERVVLFMSDWQLRDFITKFEIATRIVDVECASVWCTYPALFKVVVNNTDTDEESVYELCGKCADNALETRSSNHIVTQQLIEV